VSLSLGGGYSCGLTAAGGAYCWGANLFGNFGNGKEVVDGACELAVSTRPYCTSPVAAALGLTLRTLEPGSWHACGSALEGTVYCWGSNATGQVGDGPTQDSSEPVMVRAAP
jgi:alpha-tubulin suppressor-like RCC1 family protein